jgi:hypothetical protein
MGKLDGGFQRGRRNKSRRTIIDHRMQTRPGEDSRLPRPNVLLNNPRAILLHHHRVRHALHADHHIMFAMLVRREHRARPQIELRNGDAQAGERGPGGGVGVADGAGGRAVLVLPIVGEVVFPLVAVRGGEDVPAVEHGRGEEELVVEVGVGVGVDGEGGGDEGQEAGEGGFEHDVGWLMVGFCVLWSDLFDMGYSKYNSNDSGISG